MAVVVAQADLRAVAVPEAEVDLLVDMMLVVLLDFQQIDPGAEEAVVAEDSGNQHQGMKLTLTLEIIKIKYILKFILIFLIPQFQM